MNKSPQPCSHLNAEHSNFFDIKPLNTKYQCGKCPYAGPNLWICLHGKCLQIGCSEQINDHSTRHFEENQSNCQLHCIHVNLSTQRAWCYICEREVTLNGIGRTVMPSTGKSLPYSGINNSKSFDVSHGMGTGLVGLQNIANTCYMNSALQALSNVFPMTHYFLTCGDLVDHTLQQSSSCYKVGLAKSYQRLICDMWRKRIDAKEYIAPRNILYGIRSVHPMFRGFQQHDTQEFLRCLMDQLHEELKEHLYRSPKQQRLIKCNAMHNNNNNHNNKVNEEETPSEVSSTSSIELDFITCESSASEESSLCDEPCTTCSLPSTLRTTKAATIATGTGTGTSTITRSIISDIFDGKLLSSVQCLTCDRISTREETFQDLSLPIPDRDFLNVLHQANSVSMQSLNSIESNSSLRVNDGWLSWLWNLLRSWLWGPSVTLHDCMSSFFSADELKGDNMYSCEKCNKLRTGVKFSKVLHLPEVLCIHLKRFRHDLSYSSKISSYVEFPLELFDMRPYLHEDCKSQISLYNLTSVICHYGTVGGGHYTCFARNTLLDRWYEFDDHCITEVSADVVQKCQAYVLFYNKHNPQIEFLRCEASELAASYPVSLKDIRFYITREWLVRFNTFAEPGPINNWTILCPHGGILQWKVPVMGQLAVPISQQLWEYLQGKFGGGPAINMLFECETCKHTAEIITRRQNYENSVFMRHSGADLNDSEAGAIYALSMNWLRKWQQFARGLTHKDPGPINNNNIIGSGCEMPIQSKFSPVRNVRLGSDYAQLNAPLWRFFHGIYGGGPEILLRPPLTEEIEIVDQDEWGDNERGDGTLIDTNISDTESNIDLNTYHVNDTKKATIIKLEEESIRQQRQQQQEEREERQHQQQQQQLKVKRSVELSKDQMSMVFGKRTDKIKRATKTKTLSNNIRKKIKSKRNDLRYTDLFGAKGNYTTNEENDVNNRKHSCNDVAEMMLEQKYAHAFNQESYIVNNSYIYNSNNISNNNNSVSNNKNNNNVSNNKNNNNDLKNNNNTATRLSIKQSGRRQVDNKYREILDKGERDKMLELKHMSISDVPSNTILIKTATSTATKNNIILKKYQKITDLKDSTDL